MKPETLKSFELSERLAVILPVLFILLALSFLNWNSHLGRLLETRVNEYSLDLAISQNQQEYERLYRDILLKGAAPGAPRQTQNEWIQGTQMLAGAHGLQMREITPVIEEGHAAKLFLIMEGEAGQWIGFLHQLAGSASLVYTENFSVSPAGGQKNKLRIEMVLEQF